MNIDRAGSIILGILVANLIASVVSLWYGYYMGEYHPDQFLALTTELLKTFGALISVAGGSFFAVKFGRQRRRVNLSSCIVATALVGLWCLLVSGRIIFFVFFSRNEEVSILITWENIISAPASYLLSGVIAYLFGNATQAE